MNGKNSQSSVLRNAVFVAVIFIIGCVSAIVFIRTMGLEKAQDTDVTKIREDANPGDPITPIDFPSNLLPGIDSPGVVPQKKYFIVYSNGDMGNTWRLNHVQDFESFGSKYTARFGIRFLWTNAGANSAQQVRDIKDLLDFKPDLLIFSANETEPLSEVYDLCQKAQVPFITVDRPIKPNAWARDDDMYICHMSMDFMYQGVVQGKMVVDYLKNKYGKPIGNIVEIQGMPKSQPGLQRSQGLHLVLDSYPDIHIIGSKRADSGQKKAYEVMKSFLNTFKKGEIDAVVSAFDEGNLGALKAIREKGRTELIGPHFGIDAYIEAMKALEKGEIQMLCETPPYYGMLAFEYGIRYLNGEKIPSRIFLPNRVYDRDHLDIVSKHVGLMVSQKKDFPLLEWGGQDKLIVDCSKYYPKSWIDDPSLEKLPAFDHCIEKPITITE